jgi:hypothetical protein
MSKLENEMVRKIAMGLIETVLIKYYSRYKNADSLAYCLVKIG